jgi:hypothetical protein
VLIFALLFILEQIDKREDFFNPSPFLVPGYEQPTSINFGQSFKNFGTFGSQPFPVCLSCNLKENAVSFPYEHGNIALDCSCRGSNLLVAGRAPGRPRECRRLL